MMMWCVCVCVRILWLYVRVCVCACVCVCVMLNVYRYLFYYNRYMGQKNCVKWADAFERKVEGTFTHTVSL